MTCQCGTYLRVALIRGKYLSETSHLQLHRWLFSLSYSLFCLKTTTAASEQHNHVSYKGLVVFNLMSPLRSKLIMLIVIWQFQNPIKGVLLGVVETIVGKLLCCGVGIYCSVSIQSFVLLTSFGDRSIHNTK